MQHSQDPGVHTARSVPRPAWQPQELSLVSSRGGAWFHEIQEGESSTNRGSRGVRHTPFGLIRYGLDGLPSP